MILEESLAGSPLVQIVWQRLQATYDDEVSCFFRPAGHFHAGLARPIWAPLGSPDGESTGVSPAASLALTLATWPARRTPNVEIIESVSRVTLPAPQGRAGDVNPLRETVIIEGKASSKSHTFSL